jgi:hypothetical protein
MLLIGAGSMAPVIGFAMQRSDLKNPRTTANATPKPTRKPKRAAARGPKVAPGPTATPTPTPPVVFSVSPRIDPENLDAIFNSIIIRMRGFDQVDDFRTQPILPGEPDTALSMAILTISLLGLVAGIRRRFRQREMSSFRGSSGPSEKTMQTYLVEDETRRFNNRVATIRADAKRKLQDEVDCTVFAPHQARRGDAFLVQAFAHLPEQIQLLEKIAKQADLDASERGSQRLGVIERGQEISCHLEMPGLDIDEPTQSLIWNGEITSWRFGVTVPDTVQPRSINCKLLISRHNIPIGHIRFNVKISPDPSSEMSSDDVKVYRDFVRYRLAFISYASADRSEVLKRVQMLELVEIRYFQDLLSLEPRKQWEPLIYRYIDECDVFFLFWSTAAKKSKWVKKEVQHALKRKGKALAFPPEIMPIPIEGPPPVKPPRYLAALHFDSRFLYFINSTDKNAH